MVLDQEHRYVPLTKNVLFVCRELMIDGLYADKEQVHLQFDSNESGSVLKCVISR